MSTVVTFDESTQFEGEVNGVGVFAAVWGQVDCAKETLVCFSIAAKMVNRNCAH